MATADQIKALIRSQLSDDSERFFTLALQVATHEAKQCHRPLAHEIRDLVDRARSEKKLASSRYSGLYAIRGGTSTSWLYACRCAGS